MIFSFKWAHQRSSFIFLEWLNLKQYSFHCKIEYMFLVARNRLLRGRKALGRNFFFWERFSFSEIGQLSKPSVARFWQSRSKKRNISRRKRIGREVFYRWCNRFLAAKIHFLGWLNVMTPNKSLELQQVKSLMTPCFEKFWNWSKSFQEFHWK